MFIEGQKGSVKIRIKINNLTNQNLINEWHNIRCINDDCNPLINSECSYCDYDKCQEHLSYEEALTGELVDRGLFDYALNKYSCKIKEILTQEKMSISDLSLYYS
ncbi:MAG: hypothetical protein FK734_18990 [Asgard group archaeon]|nr:hypothetical protein [Asgard group archaeon]